MRRLRRIALVVLFAAPLSAAAQDLPPHAWLFGSWTGGFFPVEGRVNPVACLAQPVVIFTKDLVLRATLTSQTYIQRVIETVRETTNGVEFRFVAPSAPPPSAEAGLLGLDVHGPGGFGCDSPDVLHVVRNADQSIVFQGCNDFPYPLVRCPGFVVLEHPAAPAHRRR